MYTEVTNNEVTYDLTGEGVTWDSGGVLWDVIGNVELTNWDSVSISYSDTTDNSATWTEV